ncbi:MAG TPA: urea transporter [Arachidicoccus sp.]|nr:urea transporter [Arachidicoccus sp.]
MGNKRVAFTAGKTFFNGLSQIMLQENPITGMLFLAGIFCGSLEMGIAAIVAVIFGSLTSVALRYPPEEISQGLYGFSAALVGIAVALLFQPTNARWLLIAIGAVLTTIIQHFFIARDAPGFTFPFIIVTWLFLFVLPNFPQLVALNTDGVVKLDDAGYATVIHGFGQIIFQDNLWAGVLFIIGILISSRVATLFGMISAILSGFLAYVFGEPVTAIYGGLLSYNAVLCAITFAGSKKSDIILGFIAVVLATLIMMLMRRLQLPALTFPFVLASWFTLIIKNRTHLFAGRTNRDIWID